MLKYESSLKVEVFKSSDQTGFNLLAFLINSTSDMGFIQYGFLNLHGLLTARKNWSASYC